MIEQEQLKQQAIDLKLHGLIAHWQEVTDEQHTGLAQWLDEAAIAEKKNRHADKIKVYPHSLYSHKKVPCKLVKLTMRLQAYDTIYRLKIQPLLFTALQTFKTSGTATQNH